MWFCSCHRRPKAPRVLPSAFTLVELLVVITIIGILVALLIPVLGVARASVQETAVTTEVAALSHALEAFRTQHQVDYPPDFSDVDMGQDAEDVRRLLSRLYRNRANDDLPFNLETLRPDPDWFQNLDPAEALFFWLRGFSDNPRYPLYGAPPNQRLQQAGAANPKAFLLLEFQNVSTTPLFDFDKSGNRLQDLDQDGFPEYYPRYGSQMPYVYYVNTSYLSAHRLGPRLVVRMGPNAKLNQEWGLSDENGDNNAQLWPPRPYYSTQLTQERPFAALDKYQIICAGLDGKFGRSRFSDEEAPLYLYPEGPYPEKAHRDNITNFAEGTLEDKMP